MHALAGSEGRSFYLGLVAIGASGASDHPTFLSLQVAQGHEWLLKVLAVEDRAVHPVNAHHCTTGFATIDGDLGSGVILITGSAEG